MKCMSDKILNIPSMSMFNYNWDLLMMFIENEGNPPFHIDGNLYLVGKNITTLGNLISVGDNLNLSYSHIEDLGNLVSVGGSLYLTSTPIKTLGNLKYVGGSLLLNSFINSHMTVKQIRKKVNIGVGVYEL